MEPPAPIRIREGAYLPHLTRDGATYAVTFRLGDSLPQAVLRSWLAERSHIVALAEQQGRPLSPHEEKRLVQLHSERVERYLDSGVGECWLRNPQVAALVKGALEHFEGARYVQHAWCIIPNHVHTVFRACPRQELDAILHSWKSFTALKANRLLGREGEFWQPESYDHLIRDEEDFDRAVRYVLSNPRAAGLDRWPWVCASSQVAVRLGWARP